MDRDARRERAADERAPDQRPADQIVREALEPAAATEALDEALRAEGRELLPAAPEALTAFLEGALFYALVGRVHPVTARAIVDQIVERLAESEPQDSARPTEHAVTVPPPPLTGDDDAYEALATGAVHTRATPAWGLRRTGEGDALVPAVWLLVSTDGALLELARRGAPAGTDVVEVSSMAVLKGALGRGGGASCVVLDAASPSISFDRAVAVLTEDAGSARIVLWGMDDAGRERLSAAVPMTRTWVACEAEVTAREIVQLLGA